MSKRQEIRQKRLRQQKKQRFIYTGIITAFALLVAALLIAPNFRPVGTIVEITPIARPQAVGNAMGDPNAPVKVEEYADFQCPACMRFAKNIEPQIIQQYVATGKVYYVFKTFSFLGQESVDAAQAAYCAMDQGKFWEYHDILFANQNGENIGDFTIPRLKAFADTLGLDSSTFNACLDGETHKRKVNDDRASGSNLGVNATPSFVVNEKLVYSDKLISTIEEELAKNPAQ
ncbi:MAG: DsbA family protein [Anaerolineae bacterium]|nr:DsbA family protein [Anaerolineae bacterium]